MGSGLVTGGSSGGAERAGGGMSHNSSSSQLNNSGNYDVGVNEQCTPPDQTVSSGSSSPSKRLRVGKNSIPKRKNPTVQARQLVITQDGGVQQLDSGGLSTLYHNRSHHSNQQSKGTAQ